MSSTPITELPGPPENAGLRERMGRSTRRSFTRARMERVVANGGAVAAVLFSLQTLMVTAEQWPKLHHPWSVVVDLLHYGALLAVVVTAVLHRGARPAAGGYALVFLALLLLWPLLADPAHATHERPWLWYFCNVATSLAAIAFPSWLAAVYTVAVPVAFLGVHMHPLGGGASFAAALLDAWYMGILGAVILVILTMLRRAGDLVDTSQAAAMERYLAAARTNARDRERVRVDALVHDSVLTTLLTAAQQPGPELDTPERRQLIVEMAGTALRHLHDNAVPAEDATLSTGVLIERLEEASQRFSARFVAEQLIPFPEQLPAMVVEALSAAAQQAILNSRQHAGAGTARSVRVQALAAGGVQIEVVDDGQGFDPGTVPIERLGLRVSIVERMADVGGRAEIHSARGQGARVLLRWDGQVP